MKKMKEKPKRKKKRRTSFEDGKTDHSSTQKKKARRYQ
jgi:hypothetical protein